MQSEKLLILNMLEDGTITADEAVKLLAALTPPTVANTLPPKDAVEHKHRPERATEEQIVREAERKARREARKSAAQARAVEQETADQVTEGKKKRSSPESAIIASLRALGIAGGGETFSFTRVLKGEFLAEQPVLRLQNTNGRIEIGKSTDQDWHLTLTTRVRANDKDSAAEISAKLVQVESDDQNLTVQARRMFGQNASVGIELLLPPLQFADAHIATTNGSIQVTDLKAKQANLKTVNGKVEGVDLDIADLHASAVNGALTINGKVRCLNGRSTNGRIVVGITSVVDSNLDLKTVNGSIKVSLPQDNNVGHYLDIATVSGSIKTSLPGLETLEEQRRPGRRTLIAASHDLEAKQLRQNIKARTVSGAVRINV